MGRYGRSVQWSQAPLTFELHSSDSTLLDRAVVLFHSWLSPDEIENAAWSWQIEPVRERGGELPISWEIRSSNGAEPIRKEHPEQALTTVEFLAVQALLEHPFQQLSLHAALVAKEGNGIVILGPGEAGKSTLACELWKHGWSLLGDDMTFVDVARRCARPAPRRVSLRASSRDLLGEDLWRRILASSSCMQTSEGYVFHPYEVDKVPLLKETRLKAAIFLARPRSASAPAVARKLEPARALLAMLPFSNVSLRYDLGEAIRRMQPLAAALPVYDLGRGSLPDMVRSIEMVLAEVT